MNSLIDLNSYPVKQSLNNLLIDRTTRKNIIWATSSYESMGAEYKAENQIENNMLLSGIIIPRISKALEHQIERTKSKGEVFTPAWICNQMNNYCDEEWFGRKNVFNAQYDTTWVTTQEPIDFGKAKWTKYVDSNRLEITCGEAPYLVSRYDASTGEMIDIPDRIGILDRKLRVVNENATDEKEWLKWAVRAFQSCYGYEYQGDNLLIARINLLLTFTEYLDYMWHREATDKELKLVTKIITWNIWQMDGLTGMIPLGAPKDENHQYTLMEMMTGVPETEEIESECKIFDWRSNESMYYKTIKENRKQ